MMLQLLAPIGARPTALTPRRGRRAALLALLVAGCSGPTTDAGSAVPPLPAPAGGSAWAAEANREILGARRTTRPDSAASTASRAYTIGAGDVLEVQVFGAEAFSGAYRIGEDGAIAIPLMGPVPVAGVSPRQVETLLTERLGATYMRDPRVTVQVTEVRSQGVSVLGAVGRPGVYQLRGATPLLEVLAQAEGLAEGAGGTVLIARAGTAPDSANAPASEVIEVDLSGLLGGPAGDVDVSVRPGDVVRVTPAGLVYVVGEVNRPGGFAAPPGRSLTVLQALAMAQGLTGTAAADRSVIVRRLPDGSRHEAPVDLDEIVDGAASPPTMAPDDVLFVPKNGLKSFTLGLVNGLVRMVTFRGLFY